jgi:hypothetical protein
MSTIGYDSWAEDLAEVGAVYPFQGSEGLMVVLGVVFWIAWHRIQFVREGAHLDKAKRMGDTEKIHNLLEKY